MTKEEIYERYWKDLVMLRRQFAGRDIDCDAAFQNLKRQIEKERDDRLKKYGYTPFHE